MEHQQTPRVGTGILIFKDGKILLGKRIGLHAAGVFAGPGGHLEYMEKVEECVRREIREETGLEVKNVRFLCLTSLRVDNPSEPAPRHYIDIGLVADWKSGEPQTLEPEKCAGWNWYTLDALPAPLFTNAVNYIDALKSGKTFYENL